MSQLPPRRDFNSFPNRDQNRDPNRNSPRYGARRPSFNNAPRPAPRRPVKPKGPSAPAAVEPASGKERRRMLKAAAWRLAHLLSMRPADVLTSDPDKLEDLIHSVEAPKGSPPGHVTSIGPLIRLAEKVRRLKRPA